MNDSSQQQLSQRFPLRATSWRLSDRTLQLTRVPLLMGILNVTPDSFSDGGQWFDPSRAIDQALRMESEGADILDIGGESTRPYSTPVDAREELRRVIPVIDQLRGRISIPISIDTMKADVAREATAAGASIINDVSGLESAEMVKVALEAQAGVCAMHMQGTPQTMQDNPSYNNVVAEVLDYLHKRLAQLLSTGLDPARICLDPGIGFGKTHQHNLDLMAACGRFHELGQPLLVGHSRKGFLAKILGDKDKDRTQATVAAALALAANGVQVIRVHDVRVHRESLESFAAVGGVDGIPLQLPR